MLYVQRDADGNIIALSREPASGSDETLPPSDPEVLKFIATGSDRHPSLQFLSTSDLDLIRVLEDLVDVLIQKNIIRFTDLPDSAQQKLLHRKSARNALQTGEQFILEQDDIL